MHPWTIGSISADRGIDETGIGGAQSFVSETETIHDSGAVVLDENITLVGKSMEDANTVARRQVDAQALLASVLLDEIRRQ